MIRTVDLIQKKQKKEELTQTEIEFLLNGYLKDQIPDYQMSSFLMAVYFNGMSDDELHFFTNKMLHSGETINFCGIDKFLIDKHSTGGVGDKTTISFAPLLASFDISTAKLTGRGLGYTGGTTDKFESIPGFVFPETKSDLIKIVNQTGIGLMSYSDFVVPLDKKLYALRDVTSTVQSIPLIASSIMSKKLAIYADGIILDVKVGSGTFMKSMEEATQLSETMIKMGKRFKRNVTAILSNMNQPLGNAVGNSLEIIEAIETLKGKGPDDFSELVYTLVAIALKIKGEVKDIASGITKVKAMIKTGKPIEIFRNFIKANHGNGDLVDDYSLLPVSLKIYEIKSTTNGYVSRIEAELIGKAAMILGAGRVTKDDSIDHSVGIVLNKKVGDKIVIGEVLAKIYYQNKESLNSSIELFNKALSYSNYKVEKNQIIFSIKN